jgi:Kef-type K+ transport system membrane component KefB
MTTAAVRQSERWTLAGLVGLQMLMILTGRWWPGSIAHTLVRIAVFSYFSIWLGLKIRTGYSRRRPHWTRQSWLRYLRLAVMPVVAIALLLLLSSIDTSSSVLGAPQSATRIVWIVILFAMMLFGTVGLVTAIEWLERGEPTEQFTRTRWFQRRRRRAIAS